MAYTFANAKIEVARTIGGQNDADELLAAGIAINKAIRLWSREHLWEFLRLDNLLDFSVATITSSGAGDTILTTTIPNGFANVYVGTTVKGHADVVAGTKVASKTSNTVIVVDTNLTAPIVAQSLTFTGPIPVRVDVSDYDLPYRIIKPSYARLQTADRTLEYWRSRYINRITEPESDGVGVFGYTFQPIQGQADAQGILPLPTTKIRLYSDPIEADLLVFEAFRSIQIFLNDLSVNDEARPLDVPEEFEDDLLECATYFYQNNKDSEVARTQDKKQNAMYFLRRAIVRDMGILDEEERFIPTDEYMTTGYPHRWMNDWVL